MGLPSLKNVLISVIVLVCSLTFQDNLWSFINYFDLFSSHLSDDIPAYVLSEETLREHNGETSDQLYLCLMGNIFDVSTGRQHYGKNSAYSYFVGKDGSRSFITGDFQDNSDNKDHVLDLSCDELATLDHWVDTMKEKYIYIGVLNGRYYDRYGKETEYSKQLSLKRKQCVLEKKLEQKEKLKFPPCNIKWQVDEGTQVWCSKGSGGINRSWAGVPRQLYTPGEEHPRCVCVNLKEIHNADTGLLKVYNNCSPNSEICTNV